MVLIIEAIMALERKSQYKYTYIIEWFCTVDTHKTPKPIIMVNPTFFSVGRCSFHKNVMGKKARIRSVKEFHAVKTVKKVSSKTMWKYIHPWKYE